MGLTNKPWRDIVSTSLNAREASEFEFLMKHYSKKAGKELSRYEALKMIIAGHYECVNNPDS